MDKSIRIKKLLMYHAKYSKLSSEKLNKEKEILKEKIESVELEERYRAAGLGTKNK